jgi:uncharacterized protein (DUF2267 family)
VEVHHDEFLTRVREIGEYPSYAQAEQATYKVLSVLGERLLTSQARDLAAQLPQPLAEVLLTANTGQAESLGLAEFVRRAAALAPPSSETSAIWDASAVLTAIAETVSGAQLNELISRMSSEVAMSGVTPSETTRAESRSPSSAEAAQRDAHTAGRDRAEPRHPNRHASAVLGARHLNPSPAETTQFGV